MLHQFQVEINYLLHIIESFESQDKPNVLDYFWPIFYKGICSLRNVSRALDRI